ncbi:MAG: hypothetical protein LKM39_01725 [Chiayiivirga sp.]|jgi:hypothetical protein|nr:hypothetical protein [Chiayiivirga sp.]MCI1709240.1 hypothetical protein [Chiayiivirga sp.]
MLVAATALVGVGGAWLALHQAEVLVDRALAIVLGPGESAHRSIMLTPDGQIVVEDAVFRPADAPDAVHVERLRMETPGWRWFLRNALVPELRDARLDRLRLSLNGVRVDNDGALPLKDLGVFGVASASPWDADGCPPEVRWTRRTLDETPPWRCSTASNIASRFCSRPRVSRRGLAKTGLARPPPTQQTARKGRLNFLYALPPVSGG